MKWVMAAVLFSLAACGGDMSAGKTARQFTTDDLGSNPQCSATAPLQICEVSSGAEVLGDGGVLNGTQTCHTACSDSQRSVTCAGGATLADTSGCTVVPIPTPAGQTFYCCPDPS